MKTPIMIIFFTIHSFIHAQSSTDSIHVMKSLGTFFVQNDKKLKPKHLLNITSNSPEAHNKMLEAKSNYNMGYIFGSVGGFMLGWSLGDALVGNDPNWALTAAGAGLTAVSIAFTAAYNKKAKEAIHIYNRGLSDTTKHESELEFRISDSGIGMLITF